MSIFQQILFCVSILGAFNGFVLAFYLLLNKKSWSASTIFLAVLLLAISIRVGKSVFLYFNPGIPKICLQIGLSACFLIGPSLYYFTRAALGYRAQHKTIAWVWVALLTVLLAGGYLVPYHSYPYIWNNIVVYIIYAQWCLFVLATGVLLFKQLKALVRDRTSLTTKEKLALLVFIGNTVLFIVYALSLFRVVKGMYISGAVAFSFILYLTIFATVFNAALKQAPGQPAEPASPKTPRKKIPDADATSLIQRLELALRDNKGYKDPALKLSDVAQKVNLTGHQLSQLLNENLGKSFSTYINEYRIEEACRLIMTDDRLTFEAIGYEVGFNSKSAFYTAFNKITDTTPALYKQSMQKNTAG